MQMNQQMQMLQSRYWYRAGDYLVNDKFKFKVSMKDGTIREVTSKIYTDTVLRKSYLLFKNKEVPKNDSLREQRIYPDQTLQISRVFGGNTTGMAAAGEVIVGAATDTCWLFKAVKGKITAYSFLSERMNLNTLYLNAFQLDNGIIEKLDPERLKTIIQNDPKAMKAFEKKDYYTAIVKFNKSARKQASAD